MNSYITKIASTKANLILNIADSLLAQSKHCDFKSTWEMCKEAMQAEKKNSEKQSVRGI